MPNRLVHEKSPYLLQHSHNPVDWYPWGEEALARAREEDRPILLSIGYSACHWCHVMERESFEDAETAALMNRSFINVKVDREERPDLDGIYMRAIQVLTGRGGWPLTAFLTPEGKAFYGGTYFPPEPRHGMPSFRQVLAAVMDAYRNRRDEVERGSDQLLGAISPDARPQGGVQENSPGEAPIPNEVPPGTLEHAFRFLRARFDPAHGGFGPAPKFPQPTTLEFLLRVFHRSGEPEALEMVLHTLRGMARGGLRDHLGGGFHRYSVDGRWLVPHFEKMLYDNGLLARIFLHAYQITGDPELRDVASSTLDYILEDLTHPLGGFYSARDADSAGEEGLFYLWTPGEVDETLGEAAGERFRTIYDVTEGGNFEGRNILNLPRSLSTVAESVGMDVRELEEEMTRARAKLKERRIGREAPFRDEKVLTGWNSFVLRALAEAGIVLEREDYLEAARKNANFLLGSLRPDGRLLRSWKEGPGKIRAFLEDHAGLGNALLTLYEATLEVRWLQEARTLTESTLDLFWDDEAGIFYDAPRDGEPLILRPRDVMDNATPSGNSLAVELLLRSGRIFGEERYLEGAKRALAPEARATGRYPSAFGRLLSVQASLLDPPLEVVLLGSPEDTGTESLLREVHRPYAPNKVVIGGETDALPPLPLLQGRSPRGGRPTAYVCRNFTCGPPITDPEELAREVREG
ncbi:MAG: thioredoxin domain-containing protein [Longimicrobiales bacterium]